MRDPVRDRDPVRCGSASGVADARGRTGPLAGLRVLEVGHILAGPYATMLLADLGAEVTKVEPPGGDLSRQVSDAYFASLNRGKRSVRLDLTTPAARPACTTWPATPTPCW